MRAGVFAALGRDNELADRVEIVGGVVKHSGTFPKTKLPIHVLEPITVAGDSSTIGFAGTSPVGGIQIQAFANGNVTPLATTTSAATTGVYTMTAATGGVPINGYLVGTGATYMPNYLYPPTPLFQNIGDGAILMVEPSIYNAIHLLVQADNDKAKGFVGLLVIDCLGNPVPGATVTVTGATAIHYSGANGLPSAAATVTATDGQAYAFGVTPGTVTVDATVGGMSLREHVITVRTAVVTTTVIAP